MQGNRNAQPKSTGRAHAKSNVHDPGAQGWEDLRSFPFWFQVMYLLLARTVRSAFQKRVRSLIHEAQHGLDFVPETWLKFNVILCSSSSSSYSP